MPDSLLTRSWLRIRYYRKGLPWYGLVLRVLIDGLAKLGFRIEPYYLMLEGVPAGGLPHLESGFSDYALGFLGPQDMKALAAIPGRVFSEEELLRRLQEGKLCLGVTYRGEIVAFTWCNLEDCTFEQHRLFLLRENEAYLFDAYTVESFRGKDIAPSMRYRCYQELAKLGKEKCYSITVVFNVPATNFKKKLGAQVLELDVFVELLRKWRFYYSLKRYR